MRQLSAWAVTSALPVLVGLACSDDSNGPLDPGPGPDEERIAFSSDRDGDFEIYVMNVDGTEVEQLTDDPGPATNAFDRTPEWSPDGDFILFATDRDGFPDREIYVMTAAGADPVNLTENVGVDTDPAWGPEP
jgi:TolB protein